MSFRFLDGREPAPGPCAGIRVLDFTTVISGPLCTQMLGDLGADVIKVEGPAGDPARHTGGPYREAGYSGFFAQFNRNKRSLVLDLSREDARAAARRLASGVDVVVQNFRPDVAERLGIGYEALSADNPGLVHVAITGFGSDGPYAGLPAYDHVIQGMTGLMPVQGGSGAPRLVQGGVADKATALVATAAITAALLARERAGGRGQRIDVPMLDAYASFALPEAMIARTFPGLSPENVSMSDVFHTWETSDGHVVGLVIQDAQFLGLCRALGLEELASDERFATLGQRFLHIHELIPLLADEMRKRPTAEFIARAREHGAPFAPVNDLDDFLADAQVDHNQTVSESRDDRFGPTRYLRHPVRYARTPASLRRHPPRLGEHADAVLAEAGFSGDEIRRLHESGALGRDAKG